MQGNVQNPAIVAWQSTAAARVKYGPTAALLAGAAVILVCLGLIANSGSIRSIPASFEVEDPEMCLSHYLIDTDFLTRCALTHKVALEQTRVIAPEIRELILKLAASAPAE